MALEPGQVVDNFRLDQTIHRGRATTVFAATDLSLGRRVAFKVLAPELAADEQRRQRFIAEAQTAASLDEHANIVTVHKWGELVPPPGSTDIAPTIYYVTQFIAGISIAELIERQPGGAGLPVSDVANVLGQIAEALDFAHRHGAVHRDVKPANIMLQMTETPRRAFLVDFGITKVVERQGGPETATDTPGQFLGTVGYAAPEQITGGQVDDRTDVYGLACTAFDMLAGSPPYSDLPEDQRLRAPLERTPPRLSTFRDGLPAGVDPVLAKGMSLSPTDRYPTCTAFVNALRAELPTEAQQYARDMGTATPRKALPLEQPQPPKRTWPVVLAVAVVVFAGLGAGWVLTDGVRNPGVDVAIGRNVTIPTTTTTTTTTTTSTTTTSTTAPPVIGVYGDVVGKPPSADSPQGAYALAIQSRAVDVPAAPGSPALYYAEWARLLGPATPSNNAVTTKNGYRVVADETVELRDFVLDADNQVTSFTECWDDTCRPLDGSDGLVMTPSCEAGTDGCPTVMPDSQRFTAFKVMDVVMRAPAASALYRIQYPEPPPGPDGQPGTTVEPPPSIVEMTNTGRSVRFRANGEFFALTFSRAPERNTEDTITITYSDGTQDRLVIRYG